MVNIIYAIIIFGFVLGLSGCSDPSHDEIYELKPAKPAISQEALTSLRTDYANKVKTARDKTCKSYDERDSLPISHSYAIHVIKLRAAERDSSSAINEPLEMHSHVLCALENGEKQPIFMPKLDENSGYSIKYPAENDELTYVIDGLRAGFVLGHPIVGLMLASSTHQIMGAFKEDGEFLIIDSMSGGLINAEEFARSLNQADILNKNGFPIKFFGKSIGTRLQKGGNDCIRLAALYLRQILKDKDLNAYQKVNGAFVDDILHNFEDIARIDNARSIAIVEPVIDRKRDQFMHSWDHRNHGMFHDRGWHGIKVGDLRPQSAGGKEGNAHKYQLWTNFGDGIWPIELARQCNGGLSFCPKRKRNERVFSLHFNNLDDVRAEALNVLNLRVASVTNLTSTLDALMDPHHYRQGLLYLRDTDEFFTIELDNAFVDL